MKKKMDANNTELLKTLVKEVQDIKKIIVMDLLKEKTQNEAALVLRNLGYLPKEIAEILGTTPNTIRVTLARYKNRSGKINK